MLRKIIPGLLFLLVAGCALAQTKPETKHVTGEVKSISADSMVVTVDEKDWTFIVDEDTNVVAKDADTDVVAKDADTDVVAKDADTDVVATSRKAKGAKETTMITDFVKVEQTVTVDYLDNGGKFTAKEVRVS